MGGFKKQDALPRTLGYMSGTLMCVGMIIGSGIFSTPALMLDNVGSPGMVIVIFIIGALVSICGTWAYVDLGTQMPVSGGEKEYLAVQYPKPRELAAFSFAQTLIWLIRPANCASDVIAFGQYMVYAFYGKGGVESDYVKENYLWIVRILAIGGMIVITFLHGVVPKIGLKFQDILTMVKIVMLASIIIGGCISALGMGVELPSDVLVSNPFGNTIIDPNGLASALFSVFFAYDGWNNLNYSLDELKDPVKLLPKCAFSAVVLTSVLYLGCCISFFVGVPLDVIDPKSAVLAAQFFTRLAGPTLGARVFPFLIGFSAFGSTMSMTYSASRVMFEAAREGYLFHPEYLGGISKDGAPFWALIMHGALTIAYCAIPGGNVYKLLIDLAGYPEWLYYGLSVIGIFVLQKSKPDSVRPVPSSPITNGIFIFASLFMLIAPFIPPATPGDIPFWLYPTIGWLWVIGTIIVWYFVVIQFSRLDNSFNAAVKNRVKSRESMHYESEFIVDETTVESRDQESQRITDSTPLLSGSEIPVQYSIPLAGPVIPNEGKPRRSITFSGSPLASLPPDVQNLHENFLHGQRLSGVNGEFLGYRGMATGIPGGYQWITYQQFFLRIKNLGSSFSQFGVRSGSNVALYSTNRVEWVLAEHACYLYGYVTVPLYDTLGEASIEYILKLCECRVVVTTAEAAKKLLELSSKLPNLKHIIIMDNMPRSLVESGRAVHVEIVSLREAEASGRENPQPKAQTNRDTIATICFTSGTTGTPKGAMLTHGNILSFVASAVQMQEKKLLTNFTKDDVHFSYLPLAHVFERIIQAAVIYNGAKIGFYGGYVTKIMDDVAVLRPSIFPAVPRVYNKMYEKVMNLLNQKGGLSLYLFNKAYKSKQILLKSEKNIHVFWDLLVFRKIKRLLGGNVKLLLSGAAPIAPHVVEFLRICFSSDFIEGYGQTESTGAACATNVTDFSVGNVGVPLPSSMIKLRDVPVLNYFSTDLPHPRGEICIKGNNIFKGYYKEPKKTEEALSSDGWCYTGDVGMWDANGRLCVIDRVKNIFKLAQGEYIAPERIEVILAQHKAVSQIFVYGDSMQSFLVGIVVIDETTFPEWCKERGFEASSIQNLISKKEVNLGVQSALEEFGKRNGLNGFECLKKVHLEIDPFSVENGLLTPTMKLMRHTAKKRYQSVLDELYRGAT